MKNDQVYEAISCLDPQWIQEASQPVQHKKKWMRLVLVAACAAVMLATVFVASAKVYTSWKMGEIKRFDAVAHLKETGRNETHVSETFWEQDGEYQIYPKIWHEAYPLDEEIKRIFEPRGERKIYFDSIADMNREWNLDVLYSPLLKSRDGEQLRVYGAYREAMNDKLYLLCTQNLELEGYEDLYCAAGFTIYTYEGEDIGFGAGIKENNYEFTQMYIENLQTTAEVIQSEDQGISAVDVCFYKDALVYYYCFSCRGEVDMSAVTAVLESLE